MEKSKGRLFVTSVLTDSMFNELVLGPDCLVTCSKVLNGVEELAGKRGLISGIREQAIVNTLRAGGVMIRADLIKVILRPGDTLYVVDPGTKLRGAGLKILPEHANLTLKVYRIWKRSDYIESVSK